MILCICNSISEREVDAAIEEGAQSLDEVAKACNAGTDCGCCASEIEQRICSNTGEACDAVKHGRAACWAQPSNGGHP